VLAYDTAQARAIAIADLVTTGTAMQYPTKVLAPVESQQAQEFHAQQRKLWQEHASWERFLIISNLSGLPDLEVTTARLVRNQRELGDSFKVVLGEAGGDQLTQMLVDHVAGEVSVIEAMKAENEMAAGAARAMWVANADQLAAFLSAGIPALDAAQVRVEMRDHLEHTSAQAAHRLAAEYRQEIDDFDAALTGGLEFADSLSAGVATQGGDQSVPAN
jgi:hypothetical protein